jgi:N4-gp56 family major capsid protein
MANTYVSTSSSSLGGTVGSAGLVQKAYDRLVEFALRTQPLIRSVADKRPANLTNPGSTVTFQLYNDLSRVSSNLTETVDPDAVGLATPKSVSVTLNEYGNAVLVTRALNLFSLADVDPAIANIIAYNMADSVDELAQSALDGGTNVIYGGSQTATASITGSDVITAGNVRKAVSKLRANNAVARKGSLYWCGIHPEVAHDLRASTGAANWRDPHVYSDPAGIWAGEIGAFEGAYFIESPRLKSAGDGANVGSAVSVSGIVLDGTTATATAASHGFSTGDFVTIAGATGVTGVNGSQKIIVTGTNTFTFSSSLTGTVTGTITAQKKAKVYRTFIAGQQALAEAVAEEPHVVIGPVVDKLMRHRPMGWYGVLGFSRFREEALYRIETGSSIA